MQCGLSGMKVTYLDWVPDGEGMTIESRVDNIEPLLPQMGNVREDGGFRSLGGRCSNIADMRHKLIKSFERTGPEFARIDVSTVVADANDPSATRFSQRTMARLLAMQLVGAGYDLKTTTRFAEQDPRTKPLIGHPAGFKGHGVAGVLLHGISTRNRKIEKITVFMQTARTLSRQYLQTHESNCGTERSLGATDQLVHRARLILLSADPQRLRDNPQLVKSLVDKLNTFETAVIGGYAGSQQAVQFSDQLVAAKSVLLPK